MVSPAPCYLTSTSAIEHIAQIGHRGSASLPAVATSLGAPSADVAFELGQRRHRSELLCAYAEVSREKRSCKACCVSKVRLDVAKQLCKLQSEQPCNSVKCGGMGFTETYHSIGQSCGPNKSAQQEHERHTNHGSGDDVA